MVALLTVETVTTPAEVSSSTVFKVIKAETSVLGDVLNDVIASTLVPANVVICDTTLLIDASKKIRRDNCFGCWGHSATDAVMEAYLSTRGCSEIFEKKCEHILASSPTRRAFCLILFMARPWMPMLAFQES